MSTYAYAILSVAAVLVAVRCDSMDARDLQHLHSHTFVTLVHEFFHKTRGCTGGQLVSGFVSGNIRIPPAACTHFLEPQCRQQDVGLYIRPNGMQMNAK